MGSVSFPSGTNRQTLEGIETDNNRDDISQADAQRVVERLRTYARTQSGVPGGATDTVVDQYLRDNNQFNHLRVDGSTSEVSYARIFGVANPGQTIPPTPTPSTTPTSTEPSAPTPTSAGSATTSVPVGPISTPPATAPAISPALALQLLPLRDAATQEATARQLAANPEAQDLVRQLSGNTSLTPDEIQGILNRPETRTGINQVVTTLTPVTGGLPNLAGLPAALNNQSIRTLFTQALAAVRPGVSTTPSSTSETPPVGTTEAVDTPAEAPASAPAANTPPPSPPVSFSAGLDAYYLGQEYPNGGGTGGEVGARGTLRLPLSNPSHLFLDVFGRGGIYRGGADWTARNGQAANFNYSGVYVGGGLNLVWRPTRGISLFGGGHATGRFGDGTSDIGSDHVAPGATGPSSESGRSGCYIPLANGSVRAQSCEFSSAAFGLQAGAQGHIGPLSIGGEFLWNPSNQVSATLPGRASSITVNIPEYGLGVSATYVFGDFTPPRRATPPTISIPASAVTEASNGDMIIILPAGIHWPEGARTAWIGESIIEGFDPTRSGLSIPRGLLQNGENTVSFKDGEGNVVGYFRFTVPARVQTPPPAPQVEEVAAPTGPTVSVMDLGPVRFRFNRTILRPTGNTPPDVTIGRMVPRDDEHFPSNARVRVTIQAIPPEGDELENFNSRTVVLRQASPLVANSSGIDRPRTVQVSPESFTIEDVDDPSRIMDGRNRVTVELIDPDTNHIWRTSYEATVRPPYAQLSAASIIAVDGTSTTRNLHVAQPVVVSFTSDQPLARDSTVHVTIGQYAADLPAVVQDSGSNRYLIEIPVRPVLLANRGSQNSIRWSGLRLIGAGPTRRYELALPEIHLRAPGAPADVVVQNTTTPPTRLQTARRDFLLR